MTQQVIRFEVHPATKQTREYVLDTLRRAAQTSERIGRCKVMLRILYGKHSGPATFTFVNGVAKGIKPYEGYSKPQDIIFAVTS